MSDKKIITWTELMKHTKKSDLWVCIEGNVFDVTTYLAEHPGGDDILVKYSGLDATEKFQKIGHSEYARSIRDQRRVGTIETGPKPAEYLEFEKQKLVQRTEYRWSEIQKHNKDRDAWVVIDGNVYDLSNYLDAHPGGSAVILNRAGKDATKEFNDAKHPSTAIAQRETYKIGFVREPAPAPPKSNNLPIVFVVLAGLVFALVLKTFTTA